MPEILYFIDMVSDAEIEFIKELAKPRVRRFILAFSFLLIEHFIDIYWQLVLTSDESK